jgi:hypothetical protein
VAACATALAACSSSGAPHTATAPPIPATASVPADPFPAQDTTFAELSPALKRVWGDFALTVVPGRGVRDSVPAAPPLRNMTGGHVSDASARRWASAVMRRARLVQWALANRQWAFLDFLGERATQEGSTWYGASSTDTAVSLPDCAAFPSRLVLWWTDDPRDPVVVFNHVLWYFTEEFDTSCAYQVPATAGGTVTQGWAARHVVLLTGALEQDAVLGEVWRGPEVSCTDLPDHDAACER